MNENLLTQVQAFSIMQHFLSQYYFKTMADDIGGISSCLMLTCDGSPADGAFEEDWLDSVKVIIPNYCYNTLITLDQAYLIVKEFLELYCRIGFSEEVQQLINRMALDENGNIIDLEIKLLWDKSTQLALSDGPIYLKFV